MTGGLQSFVPTGVREGLKDHQEAERLREVADLCEEWAVSVQRRKRLSLSARRRVAGVPGVLREMADAIEGEGRRKAHTAVILSGGS